MIDTPQIVQTGAQRTAVVHLVIPRAAIQQEFGPALRDLQDALAAQGVTPAGPCFSYHLKMPSDTFDFEIGFPVDKAVAAAGRVTASALPASAVARSVYRGGMEGLGSAWGELAKWAAANGHTTQPFLWEIYRVGPGDSADPSAWQTELNWPLAS